MSSHRVVAACFLAAFAVPTAAANFACTVQPPVIHSISLGMPLKEVQSRVGAGVLIDRSPDPEAEWQYYYSWRLGSAKLEVVFDKAIKVVMVSISARGRYPVYGNVLLNQDTIRSVERKLGKPGSKVGPMYGEGEYTFYSLVYHCGPESGQEVLFMSELDCNRPDMEACLSEELFDTRPVRKVSIRKRTDSSDR
jgi:hypothetical protein